MHTPSLAKRVHGACVQAIRWALGFSFLFLLLSFPVALLVRPKIGRWIGLPGFWAVCIVLVAAGIGSFAKAILEAADADNIPPHRIGLAALNVLLGALYLFGGCGGFWAFTTRAIRGDG